VDDVNEDAKREGDGYDFRRSTPGGTGIQSGGEGSLALCSSVPSVVDLSTAENTELTQGSSRDSFMAKKETGKVKLQIAAGKATPGLRGSGAGAGADQHHGVFASSSCPHQPERKWKG